MEVTVNDFGLEWKRKDEKVYKADYDDFDRLVSDFLIVFFLLFIHYNQGYINKSKENSS